MNGIAVIARLIAGNQLTEIKGLGCLRVLRHLSMAKNRIESTAGLDNLQLKYLNLVGRSHDCKQLYSWYITVLMTCLSFDNRHATTSQKLPILAPYLTSRWAASRKDVSRKDRRSVMGYERNDIHGCNLHFLVPIDVVMNSLFFVQIFPFCRWSGWPRTIFIAWPVSLTTPSCGM